jgi:uncharacterized protein (TIGR02466 family)
MSSVPEVVPLFATPLVVFDVPDAVALNVELRRAIEERVRTHPSTHKSNTGGWQSSWELLAYARNLANRMTADQQGVAGQGPYPGHFAVTWIGNMWANVNRSGHGNEYHSHPGSYWSGVYYVDDGGIAADPSLGGELEFLDPRGPVPLMNAPHLRMAGHLSAGSTERVRPQAGRLVMFPAWVMHQVRPYHGRAERISIAFNLTV